MFTQKIIASALAIILMIAIASSSNAEYKERRLAIVTNLGIGPYIVDTCGCLLTAKQKTLGASVELRAGYSFFIVDSIVPEIAVGYTNIIGEEISGDALSITGGFRFGIPTRFHPYVSLDVGMQMFFPDNQNNLGIIKNPNFGFSFGIEHALNDWLKIGPNIRYGHAEKVPFYVPFIQHKEGEALFHYIVVDVRLKASF